MHGMKFFDFVNSRNGRVTLTAIEAPKTDWKGPLDVFQDGLKHEQKVTGMINDLVNLSLAEGDHAAATFLQWFVNEQVEEESNAQAIIDKLNLVGDNGVALFMIDAELAQRPAPAAAPANAGAQAA